MIAGLAVHWQALDQKLAEYLGPEARSKVERAFRLGAEAHHGQARKSGEPYITHPLAVAGILADMRLDADGLCAAILHDTLEDTPVSHAELAEHFGADVAELVDGVTKLDKVKFRSRQEANAESFRKMMLAMARDLRVILIKLADRLHNMRTLDAMSDESRRRIALETLEIYAPIAQRLGMNAIKAELQRYGFAAYHPLRHRVLEDRLRQLYGNRREGVEKIQHTIAAKLDHEGIPARLVSRVKSPYSIYTKMKTEHKTLAQVLDVYGVRVVVRETMQCYMALGAVHSLFKPVDGRFRDFIAMPKANGYQSLHTVVLADDDRPVEVQIRTAAMHEHAEHGVVEALRAVEVGGGDFEPGGDVGIQHDLAPGEGRAQRTDGSVRTPCCQRAVSRLAAGARYNPRLAIAGNPCMSAVRNTKPISLTQFLIEEQRVLQKEQVCKLIGSGFYFLQTNHIRICSF